MGKRRKPVGFFLQNWLSKNVRSITKTVFRKWKPLFKREKIFRARCFFGQVVFLVTFLLYDLESHFFFWMTWTTDFIIKKQKILSSLSEKSLNFFRTLCTKYKIHLQKSLLYISCIYQTMYKSILNKVVVHTSFVIIHYIHIDYKSY